MYAGLLEGISRRNELADAAALGPYLRNLQPRARQLWQSYRQQNVSVDYSQREVQEAYLLRYFPYYTLPLTREMDGLREIGVVLPESELLEACFFGCGPGPEVIGLMQHLVNAEASTTMLSARLVDIASETWAYSRSIVLEHIAEPSWEPRLVEYFPVSACLADGASLRQADIDRCQFAVVQNCLNEVPRSLRDRVVDNLIALFSRLPLGAIALLIDRAGYDATEDMMRCMHQRASEAVNVVPIGQVDPTQKRISCGTMLCQVPEIVTNNLFHRWGDVEPEDWLTSGLIFSKRIDYICKAFQISETAPNK